MSILVVDDQASDRELLISILHRGHYTDCIEAHSADEAYQLLGLTAEANSPPTAVRLVLMDLNMPDISGIDACRVIKAKPLFSDLPIIIITASDHPKDLLAAFDAGAADFISKPLNRVELLVRVRAALKLKDEMDRRLEQERELKEVNAVLRDVLELVKEEQAKRANLEKEKLRSDMDAERHRSVAQMVAGVAHEINTPLGTINMAASILRRQLSAEAWRSLTVKEPDLVAWQDDIEEAIGLIERNIKRAHKLIQDFKKVSVNQLTDPKETVALVEAIGETLDLFKVSAKQSNLKINFSHHLPKDQTQWLGYPGALSQVLLNLLMNAQKYAYPASRGGHIDITLEAERVGKEPYFCVVVRDFGVGIPPADLPKVFEAFFTTGRATGGSGLGLAIVHNLVTVLFKGTITVASEVNGGTAFTLKFPQVVPEA